MEEADPSDADSPMLQNNGTDIVNNLKNKTGVNSMQYQGVEKIQKNGSIAVVTIKVFDSELGKHFLVELAMQQLADDTWQITKINNLKTLINERDQALQNKLAELNAPVKCFHIDVLFKSRKIVLLYRSANKTQRILRRFDPVGKVPDYCGGYCDNGKQQQVS